MKVLIILIALFILFYKPIKHGIIDGWNGTQKHRPLYDKDYYLKLELMQQLENEKLISIEKIENEISMIEENIRKRKIIAYELEKELETVTNQNRKHAILSKLITLDNATYKDNKKIDKLMEKLENI